MSTHARLYRLLSSLYPRSFRREYAADLVQAFDDLARQHGSTAAWVRACVDLVVTVPRYHLEVVMHRPATSSALKAAALVLAVAGLASVVLGAVVALPLLAIAALVVLSERTELAKALVVPPDQRWARLRTAGLLAVVFVAAVASWIYHITRYESLTDPSVLLHNVVGVLSFVGGVSFAVAGLLSREGPAQS